eukprot:3338566-Prymnesium_polylepis.1
MERGPPTLPALCRAGARRRAAPCCVAPVSEPSVVWSKMRSICEVMSFAACASARRRPGVPVVWPFSSPHASLASAGSGLGRAATSLSLSVSRHSGGPVAVACAAWGVARAGGGARCRCRGWGVGGDPLRIVYP